MLCTNGEGYIATTQRTSQCTFSDIRTADKASDESRSRLAIEVPRVALLLDAAGIEDVLSKMFAENMDITRLAGIYSIGVGTSSLVQALAKEGLVSAPGLVAHDLTEQHQALLLQGSLSYVLHQDVHYCVLAAARVLLGLCENVRGAPNVVLPRVEILTAENLH